MLTINFKSSAKMLFQNYIPSIKKSPMKVLLVEDSILIRNALTEILNSTKNLHVDSTASTQKEAIALLNKKQFDMMLIDIELAEGNGFEVIKHAQRLEYGFKIPILIILTNHASSQYRKFASDINVNYFFDKSLDFDLAIETIELEAAKFYNTTY